MCTNSSVQSTFLGCQKSSNPQITSSRYYIISPKRWIENVLSPSVSKHTGSIGDLKSERMQVFWGSHGECQEHKTRSVLIGFQWPRKVRHWLGHRILSSLREINNSNALEISIDWQTTEQRSQKKIATDVGVDIKVSCSQELCWIEK